MREFSDAVVEFVWDFTVTDVKRVLNCTHQEAVAILRKSVKQHGPKLTANIGKKYYKAQAPIPVLEEPAARPIKRVKAEYSNKSAWDKYDI